MYIEVQNKDGSFKAAFSQFSIFDIEDGAADTLSNRISSVALSRAGSGYPEDEWANIIKMAKPWTPSVSTGTAFEVAPTSKLQVKSVTVNKKGVFNTGSNIGDIVLSVVGYKQITAPAFTVTTAAIAGVAGKSEITGVAVTTKGEFEKISDNPHAEAYIRASLTHDVFSEEPDLIINLAHYLTGGAVIEGGAGFAAAGGTLNLPAPKGSGTTSGRLSVTSVSFFPVQIAVGNQGSSGQKTIKTLDKSRIGPYILRPDRSERARSFGIDWIENYGSYDCIIRELY